MTVSKIIINGKEYSISKDKKEILRKDKKYTLDDFRERKKKNARFFAVPPQKPEEVAIYGFSDENDYEKWMKKHNFDNNYDYHKKLLDKARRLLKTEDIEEIKRIQIEEVNEANAEFDKFLKKHDLKPNELEKIQERVMEDYDPFFGGPSHTLHLYDHWHFAGEHLALPGNWFSGKYYPDLSFFNYNDRASSAMNIGSWLYTLYQNKWFSGDSISLWFPVPDLNYFWTEIFGNIASSARVF